MITAWKGQSANHKPNFNLFIIKVTLLIKDFTQRLSCMGQFLLSAVPSTKRGQGWDTSQCEEPP